MRTIPYDDLIAVLEQGAADMRFRANEIPRVSRKRAAANMAVETLNSVADYIRHRYGPDSDGVIQAPDVGLILPRHLTGGRSGEF